MTRKIFRSILLAAAVALLASLATVMGILYPYFSGLQERELGEELKLTASAVEQGGLDYLETCELMMPSCINLPFRRLSKSRRQVGYVLLTRAPVAIGLSKLRPCCPSTCMC